MKSTITSILLAIFLLPSCSTKMNIQSSFNKKLNYDKFKTYDLMRHDGEIPRKMNPINKERIANAVDRELQKLGFQNATNPDIVVAWYITRKETQEVKFIDEYYNDWVFFPTVVVNEYEKGVLVLDVIEWRNKKVIWHSKSDSEVFNDIENAERKVNSVVKSVFKKFQEDSELNSDK